MRVLQRVVITDRAGLRRGAGGGVGGLGWVGHLDSSWREVNAKSIGLVMLSRGFVVSRYFIMYSTIIGVKKIFRYTEEVRYVEVAL